MSSTQPLHPPSRVVIFCVAMLLGFVASVYADPKPLTKEEQAKVDKAIEKGVAYLKRTQQGTGAWPPDMKSYPLQTLLPAYALLEAGVPANDPAIQRAADYIRPRVLKTWRTYEISLGLLFLDRLGDPKDEPLIRSLALRLIAGQHVTGGWNYRCPELGKGQEESLYKALVELNKALEAGDKSKIDIVKTLELPRALRALAVFRDLRKLSWKDPPSTPKSAFQTQVMGTTDNSNTQFAMLGLWAAQRHGAPVGSTFRLMVERFERSQEANGRWQYAFDAQGKMHSTLHPSMICVGLLGLAVGRGLKLPAPGASKAAEMDLRILKGLAALSQDIGVAAGGGEERFTHRGAYYLWSVERVAMFYDLSMIVDKDWYRWGAGILVAAQQVSGEWPNVLVNGKDYLVRASTRPVIDTAFALLFLKHSHPMKELTAKLPYKGKELNQGAARLLMGAAPLEPSTATPSGSANPDR